MTQVTKSNLVIPLDSMLEHENVPGVVESMKIVTESSTDRLCRFAFDYAVAHGRKKVTLVHKAVRSRYVERIHSDSRMKENILLHVYL
jgi:isocitrate/isopropylmalate dehydrogenase